MNDPVIRRRTLCCVFTVQSLVPFCYHQSHCSYPINAKSLMGHNSCRYSALLSLLRRQAGACSNGTSSSFPEYQGRSARKELTAELKIFYKGYPCTLFFKTLLLLIVLRATFKVKIVLIAISSSFSHLEVLHIP